jgi:hypothetical protein
MKKNISIPTQNIEPQPAAPDSHEWYVQAKGADRKLEKQGPFSKAEIRSKLENDEISPQAPVWKKGWQNGRQHNPLQNWKTFLPICLPL